MTVILSIFYRKLDVAGVTKVDLSKLHTGSLFLCLLRIKILCDPLSGAPQFKCVPILFTFKVVGEKK